MLSVKLLWRNWRSGEVKILATALLLAVSVVSCITIFTNRLDQALIQQSHTFLAADRVIRSSQVIPDLWVDSAEQQQLRWARTTSFASMLFAGERMHLGAVKAVTSGYPLLGSLKVSEVPFATARGDIFEAVGVPKAGEVWVDSRLLSLLDTQLGQALYVGEKELRITQLLISEPDASVAGPALFGARLLMNETDLAATEVIQPGSRIDYQLLLAGNTEDLDRFIGSIELSPHQRIRSLENSQQGLAKTLDKAQDFLLLAAIIGVLLAGVAIAIAARRFSNRHIDQVALLKSLGGTVWQVRRLYAGQLLMLALLATSVGLLVGLFLQGFIASVLTEIFPLELPPASWRAYATGAFTGIVCLVCFVAPPLWHLPSVAPLKVLRRELQVSAVRYYWQGLSGLLALMILVVLLSNNLTLTMSIIGALLLLVLLVSVCSQFLLWLSHRLANRAGRIWRLALSSLQRHRRQSQVQVMVFSLAIMLLLTLSSLRTSLIADWQQQLPDEAPNHFMMNITDNEIQAVEDLLQEHNLHSDAIYPMIRARLTHINDQLPTDDLRSKVGVLRREANLSWVERLGSDNRILKGVWWDEWQPSSDVDDSVGVSVETKVAEELGLVLGDSLKFSVGGLELQATVASVRQLNWDSMNPNFYFLFSPGALDNYSPSYLTSVYIAPKDKALLSKLLRSMPTIVVIEIDRLIAQIQTIVKQVSSGVGLVLWLILAGGFLVMWAAVNASMDERKQESALLRALGSSRRLLLGGLWLEFTLLGALAGLLGAFSAQGLLFAIQQWVLKTELTVHPEMWLMGFVGGGLMIGLMGVVVCRRVVTTPPGLILREV